MEYKIKATVIEEYEKIFTVDATSEEEAKNYVKNQEYSYSSSEGIKSTDEDNFIGTEDIYNIEIVEQLK